MINRNVADYTNFDGKTNKRIVQAPGGMSSISLGWGHDNTDHTQNNKPINHKGNSYGQNQYEGYGQKQSNNMTRGYDSYEEPMGVMGHNYDKGIGSNKNIYQEQGFKQHSSKQISNNNLPIGGQHGYNNYNPINHGQNSYQNYPPTGKYPPQQAKNQPKAPFYTQKNDPASFYKPSYTQNQYDTALQQQKHKIQSSRSKRSQNTSTSIHQQGNNQTKPCVKIHQQKNNDIFGSHYDYWKQDGINGKGGNNNAKKEPQYLYEKNQQYRPVDNGIFATEKNEKTSVKVHNPPGGKTNFTFG